MIQKILFTGSREASPDMLEATREYIKKHVAGRNVIVIVGDAEGIDYQVIQTCDELEIPIEVHGAYGRMRHNTWTGKNFPHEVKSYLGRDRLMAEMVGVNDMVVAVWNGKSLKCGTVATARHASKSCPHAYWLWKKLEQP